MTTTATDSHVQIDAVVKNLESEDPIARMFAAGTLGNKGEQAKEHLPAIKKLLNDPEKNVRDAAADAIKKIEKGG